MFNPADAALISAAGYIVETYTLGEMSYDWTGLDPVTGEELFCIKYWHGFSRNGIMEYDGADAGSIDTIARMDDPDRHGYTYIPRINGTEVSWEEHEKVLSRLAEQLPPKPSLPVGICVAKFTMILPKVEREDEDGIEDENGDEDGYSS